MQRKFTSFCVPMLLCLCSVTGWSQTSNGYLNFGNPTDGTTATAVNTGFSGVRTGTGAGGFTIKNAGQEIGLAGELQGIAPTGGSINSVGIASTEFGTAATTFTVSFEVYFSGGSSGMWYFFAGNGSSFSSAQSSTFTGADVFSGIQLAYGASNTITTSNRSGGSWVTTGFTGTPFAQNTAYTVTVVGNNSTSTVNYGNSQSVAANTYDLWINGVLVGNDLAKALLAANTNVNAFRFYGLSSTGNVATISLDNIKWWNSCVAPSVSSYSTVSSIPANTYTDLNIYAAASLAGSTRVNNSLNVSAALTTNNNLTLTSNSTATAYVGPVSGSLSGNVTVERYIPAHAARAYTMVGFGAFGGTIYNNWQEAGASTVGYGTQISGASTGNGFDFASAAGISSIYTYDDPDFPSGSKWQGLFNTNNTTPSPTNNGYLLFVRGDRTVGAGSGAPMATTLRTTGSLATGHVGPVSMFTGANVYSLVANPYACAINWSTTTKTNITGSFTVYDPNLLSFVTSDGTTVSPNISQQQANIIQSGQAFFTQNDGSSNTPGWEVDETDKNISAATNAANTVFGMEAPVTQLNVNVYKTGNVFADGAVAVFGNYNKQQDTKDAAKFTNFSETVSFAENNNRFLSIDARPLPQINDTLFIDLKQMSANAAYTIMIDGKGFNSSNLQSAVLIDKVTGTNTSLDLSAKTSYSFTTTAVKEAGRLYIVLSGKPVVTVTPPTDSSYSSALQVTLLGNPVKDHISLQYTAKQAGNTTIRLINSNGQAMTSMNLGVQQQGNVNIPVAEYAGGLYLVEVTVGSNKVLTKVVKQ